MNNEERTPHFTKTTREEQAIIRLIRTTTRTNFFGEITFRFRGGECYQVNRNESLLLDELAAREE